MNTSNNYYYYTLKAGILLLLVRVDIDKISKPNNNHGQETVMHTEPWGKLHRCLTNIYYSRKRRGKCLRADLTRE